MVKECITEINTKDMKELLQQLDSNTKAIKTLDDRYKDTLKSEFFSTFGTEHQRIDELNWITKVQKRVYRMRYRILENLKREVSFEMGSVSTKTRELNLKVA